MKSSVVITDYDKEMRNAVELQLINSYLFRCNWHLGNNLKK